MKINASLIKNVAIGFLAVASIFSVISIINYNRILNNNESIMNYLEQERTIMKEQYDSLQIEYIKKQQSYIKLDSILDNKNKQLDKLKLENHYLQSTLANLENEMANVTSDSSYNYLMHRYIPTQDSLQYGFAPNQVKAIHYDVVAFDYTKLINSNLDSTLNVLSILSNTNALKFETCTEQNSLLLQQKNIMRREIESLEIVNNNYTKQIKKQRTKSTVFGIGAAGLVTYIIVKAVSK